MQILFRPPLGDILHIHAPPCDAPTQLFFTATFVSLSDYEDYSRKGARIELWSNLNGNDHWEGQSFKAGKPLSRSTPPSSKEHIFSLARDCVQDENDIAENVLTLSLFTTLTNRDAFEYTFRLVYASGEVSWLGHANNNGKVVLDRSDPVLSLHHAWSAQDPAVLSHTLSWRVSGTQVDGLEIAKLSADIWRSSVIWGLGSDGFKRVDHSHVDDRLVLTGCSSVFVVPCIHANTVSVPPVFVLTATAGSSISVTSLGAVTFSGLSDGFLSLRTYEPGTNHRQFIENVLPQSHRFQFIECDSEPGVVVVLASPKNVHPASILIVALSQNPSISSKVHIRTSTLKELQPSASRLVLFSPTTCRACSLVDVSKFGPDDVLILTGDPTGGYLIVGPVHHLGGESSPWDIAVLTPHIPVFVSDHALPTPPASPTLRPVVLRALQSSVSSSASPTDAGSSHAEFSAGGSTPLPSQTPTLSQSPVSTQTPPRSYQQSLALLARQHLVIALSVLRLLFSLLLNLVLRRNRILGLQTGICTTAGGALNAADNAGDNSDSLDPHPMSHELGVTPNTADTAALDVETDTLAKESERRFVNTLGGGNVLLLLRSRSASAAIADVIVECDGTVIKDLKVKEIEDAMFLVEFDSGVQGCRVQVSLRG